MANCCPLSACRRISPLWFLSARWAMAFMRQSVAEALRTLLHPSLHLTKIQVTVSLILEPLSSTREVGMKLMQRMQSPQSERSEIFARSIPESLEAVETYIYEKNISKTPFLRASGEPTGRIEVCVPFDGYC